MIRKVEIERFTVISARPFDEVVAAIKTSIGNSNMALEVAARGEICGRIRCRNPACLGQDWINVIRRVRSRDDRS
jgi:hypothetical protein